MQDLIQFLLNALSLGSVYALMALGLVIVFGILRLVNFAYGELIMVAGYTWFILQGQAWAMFAIAVAAVFAAALTSVLTERIAFRPIRSESLNAMLVTSFAVSTLLQNSALLFVSPRARAVEVPAVMNQNINFAGLRLGAGDLITILVSGVVLAGLALLLRRTTLGIALRAASDDFRMLRLLGKLRRSRLGGGEWCIVS